MPVASDIILDWAAKDGYSLSETGWIQAWDRKFYFEACSFSSKQARQRADTRQGQAEEPQNGQDKSDDRKHGRLLSVI